MAGSVTGAQMKTVIGVYVAAGESQKDVYHRHPVSTKHTAAEVVAALVPALFGRDAKPATFALYEAEFQDCMCALSVLVCACECMLPLGRQGRPYSKSVRAYLCACVSVCTRACAAFGPRERERERGGGCSRAYPVHATSACVLRSCADGQRVRCDHLPMRLRFCLCVSPVA
jgi:hypothetical protein